MTLGLSAGERVARAAHDLRLGLPVIVSGHLVGAVETLTPSRWQDFAALDGLDLAITARRAETLRARAYDGGLARVIPDPAASLDWVQATADPSVDLAQPMKGPYRTRRGGDVTAHRIAIDLCKRAHLLPAALVAPLPGGLPDGLSRVSADDITRLNPVHLHAVSAARVPLAVSKAGKVHVFRPDDGSEEHYAIVIGTPEQGKPVLARLHSACFTGDLIGSLKCDCGPQLRAALAQIGAEGAGVLLYLNQEGRGIGLANKMRAYGLQDQGFDTVEANHRLGFEDDERDFALGAQILHHLGFESVRLLTNNPAKIAKMESCGIKVAERVPLRVGHTAQNKDYLATKARKSGHLL